jgi:hypothetical protein
MTDPVIRHLRTVEYGRLIARAVFEPDERRRRAYADALYRMLEYRREVLRRKLQVNQ